VRVDVFQFNTEIEMLQCRAQELEGLVDMHVAIEANLTKQGDPRDFVLQGDEIPNLEVIQVDLTDISDVVLGYDIDATIQRPGYHPGAYPYADNWKRDWKQRDGVNDLIAGLPDDAIILYGDVDEIPRREVVEGFDSPVVGVLNMDLLIYSLRWSGGEWLGTTIGTKERYGDSTFAQARADRGSYPVIDMGGWHLTWFGGRKAVQAKAKANAHSEIAEDLTALDKQYANHIWPGGEVQLWKYERDVPRYVESGNAPTIWGAKKR